MDRTRLRVGTMACAGLAVVALACGDDTTQAPTGQPMARQVVEARANDDNAPPEIGRVAISPSDPMPGAMLQAIVDVSDPDGDAVRLEHRWLVNGELVSSGPSPSAKLELRKGDRVELEVVASDGRAESAPRHRSVSVGNRPPTLKGVAIQPTGDVRAGEQLAVEPFADDPDGDRVRFEVRWLVNGQEAGTGLSFATDELTRGDRVQAEVVATDGGNTTGPARSDVIEIGNTPPRITRLPSRRAEEGTFIYDFEAEDADGDRNLRFWLEEGPDGMRVDPITGQLRWTPRADQAGTHTVEVGVKDAQDEGATFVFHVTVTAEGGGETPPPADAGV